MYIVRRNQNAHTKWFEKLSVWWWWWCICVYNYSYHIAYSNKSIEAEEKFEKSLSALAVTELSLVRVHSAKKPTHTERVRDIHMCVYLNWSKFPNSDRTQSAGSETEFLVCFSARFSTCENLFFSKITSKISYTENFSSDQDHKLGSNADLCCTHTH